MIIYFIEPRPMITRVIIFYKIARYVVAIEPQQHLTLHTRTARSAPQIQYQYFSPTTDYFK